MCDSIGQGIRLTKRVCTARPHCRNCQATLWKEQNSLAVTSPPCRLVNGNLTRPPHLAGMASMRFHCPIGLLHMSFLPFKSFGSPPCVIPAKDFGHTMSACRAEHHHVWIYSSCKVHARHQLGLDISRIRIDCPAGPCAREIQNRRRPRRGVVPTVRGSCLAVDVGHCRRGPGQPRNRHVRHAAGTHGQGMYDDAASSATGMTLTHLRGKRSRFSSPRRSGALPTASSASRPACCSAGFSGSSAPPDTGWLCSWSCVPCWPGPRCSRCS